MRGTARGVARRGRADAGWALLAVGALVVGVVAWWAPGVGADTPLGTSGLTATNMLFEDAFNPGATCLYDPSVPSHTLTVVPPYVVGLDRELGVAEQTTIAWRAVLLQDGTPIFWTDRQLGSTSDTSSATFAPIVAAAPVVSGLLSVRVEIQWLEFPETEQEQVLGTSLRGVDFYAQNVNDGTGTTLAEGGCRILDEPTPVPTDTPEATVPTATATETPVPTATATTVPTATGTPVSTATGTPVPTNTPTIDPTLAATATPATPATATIVPTATTAPTGPPRLTLSAPRGTVNSALRVEIAGFGANTPVGVTFAGMTLATLTTNGSGSAGATFVVPAKPQGPYEVRAAAGVASATATYTVAPRIKVTSGSGGPGDQVSVSLRGFGRNEPVRIRWLVDGRWVQVGFVDRTSNTGSANVTVTIPAGADPGPASVRGDGTIARAQTNAFVVGE